MSQLSQTVAPPANAPENTQGGCPASVSKIDHGGNCLFLDIFPLSCSLSPSYHTPQGMNSITLILPIPLGAQKSPEEQEDGSPVIHLALVVVVSHEGLDGIQEAGMKFLCLIEDEQGLLAALHSLTDLILQLSLQSSREEHEKPSSCQCHRSTVQGLSRNVMG